MHRILLVAGGSIRRVLLLAEQIEAHLEGAKICGIVYRVRRGSRIERFGAITKSFGERAARVLLAFVHGGGPRKGETAGSEEDALTRRCQAGGWPLYIAGNCDSPEVMEFIRTQKPNLAAAIGIASVPQTLLRIIPQGILHGGIFSIDGSGTETPAIFKGDSKDCRIKVTHIGAEGETGLASFDFRREPLDTGLSLELKANVILRDITVQSLAAIAKHPEEAKDHVKGWMRRLIPSYLCEHSAGVPTSSGIDHAPPLQTRAAWKLCIYSFLLLPSVIIRNWVACLRKRCSVTVLNSHLISDRHHRMTLPTDAFLRVIRYLQRHYRIVSLSRACELLKSGSIQEPTLVLTFDDGYEDNFINLRAVSEEMAVPVTLFISTDLVTNHREFPHDLERGLTGFRALTWEQIHYWSFDNIEFGSHTCSHYDCGSTDEASLTRELEESKRVLEVQLHRPVAAFAFPFGKPKNMSPEAKAIAAKEYAHYLSSFGGANMPGASETHKHILRKHLYGNAWELELELQNVFERAKSTRQLIWHEGFHRKTQSSNALESEQGPTN